VTSPSVLSRLLVGPLVILSLVVAAAVTGSAAYLAVDGGTLQVFTGPGPEVSQPIPSECEDTDYAEVLIGSPGDDTFQAADGGALIFGMGGNDTLQGGNAKDCLVGGNGKDRLDGGPGTADICIGSKDETIVNCENAGIENEQTRSGSEASGDPAEDVAGSESDVTASPSPTPSSSDSPTPTPSPTPSGSPEATATPSPDPTPIVVRSEEPTPTATGSPSEEATPTPAPTPDASG